MFNTKKMKMKTNIENDNMMMMMKIWEVFNYTVIINIACNFWFCAASKWMWTRATYFNLILLYTYNKLHTIKQEKWIRTSQASWDNVWSKETIYK